MGKIILHVVSAALLADVGWRLGWASWLIVGAVMAGATLVHFIYERFFGGSTHHIGASAVSNDDPLMLDALDEASRTWPLFLPLFAQYPSDSLVKFRLTTTGGEIENVWGDLLELKDDVATVYLRTPPVGAVEIPNRRMTVSRADIIDWQVMMADGTLRGGFTQQATFRIMEREEGTLSSQFVE